MTTTLDALLAGLPLKHVARAGWLRVGISRPESVAAHSWGICFLVLQLCPPELDRGRCLALATLHDLPEVEVGDLTPHDGVSKADKHAREDAAARDLLTHRPDLLALVREYMAQDTPEARFVRELDKLDMALQALIYAPHSNTREFVESARRSVRSDAVATLIDGVLARLPD